MSPACIPVTREPTEVSSPPWPPGARSRIRSASGSSTTRKPSTFARIHPGRSTTATLPPSANASMPVTSRTGPAAAAASSRSSATTFLASVRLISGPGRTHRIAVEVATSQSIICWLLTLPPYVSPRACGAILSVGRSVAAAARELGGELVDGRAGRVQLALGHLVGHEREGQQLAVGRGG